MADQQMSPFEKDNAQDPSRAYERSHPELEAGMGRLDNNDDAVPTDVPDHIDDAVRNRQDPTHQINAEDAEDERSKPKPLDRIDHPIPGSGEAVEQPDHSMLEEEPDGWDLAPTDIHDPRMQRHPRYGGKGGTPDAGERDSRG